MKQFKVYKSAAGSGKTYTLVKEYLTIVLADPSRYKRILAVTFTNKAAQEMKQRIMESLHDLSVLRPDSTSPLALDLCRATSLSMELLSRNAKKVFEQILHHYSDFSIGTIDSFTHRIVRTFAYELKLPIEFDVELNSHTILHQAVDALLDQVGRNEEMTALLLQFTFSRLSEEKSYHIDRDLKERASQLLKENIEKQLEQIKHLKSTDFRRIAAEQKEKNRKIGEEIRLLGKKFFSVLDQQQLEETDFHQGKRGIYGFFQKVADFQGAPISIGKIVRDSIDTEVFAKSKASPSKVETLNALAPFIRSSFEQFTEKHALFLSRALFLENIFTLAVFHSLNLLKDQYMMDEALIHISEFNKRISRIVLEEPVPFIYERLGERYQHYLIDEFQDTSVLQWQNLLPLLENSLAQGLFSMVVGDSKQAIYRFRQGEVEQFETLPRVYAKGDNPFLLEKERTLEREYVLDVLEFNYRSCTEIVNFNNAFFQFLGEQYLGTNYQAIYTGNPEKRDPGAFQLSRKEGGFLCMKIIAKENYENETFEGVYKAIQQAVEDGYTLKDICILSRNHKELEKISAFLSGMSVGNQKLLMASDESFMLDSSSKVRFLIAVLRHLYDEKSQTPQLFMLEYLASVNKVKQDQLLSFFTQKSKPFSVFLLEHGYEIRSLYGTMTSLYDLAEQIIRLFALDGPPDMYLLAFLNHLMVYSRKNDQDLFTFLQWYDENKMQLSVKSSDELNAIRLMTIHKAKGLGFPVLIYPFADSKLKMTNDLWMEVKREDFGLPIALVSLKKSIENTCFIEAYEEERAKVILDFVNVLYVALTRAKNQLYLFFQEASENLETLSYPQFFTSFLQQKSLFSPDQCEYSFGQRVSNQQQKEAGNAELSLTTFISSDWTERSIILKEEQPGFEGAISQQKRREGVLLHQALSYIKIPQDRQAAIEKMRGSMSEEEVGSLDQALKFYLNHPAMYPFFHTQAEVSTEVEVITSRGNLRIDRLLIEKERTTVVDFKTGRKREKDKEQVALYCEVLKQMDMPSVRAYLVYLQEEEVEVLEV